MFQKFDQIFIRFCIVFALIATSYVIYKCASSDDKIQFCYIRTYAGENGLVHTLNGSRDWSTDELIYKSNDPQRVVDYAKEIECPLKLTMLST